MIDQPLDSYPIAKTISIRLAGFDESWLQEQICKNPGILTLGNLEFVRKEKIQSTGRRLDVLLKDDDENKMFEVELMLGATDETHIIRTISYWENEQRKNPEWGHVAVLVAESIDRDFFNVIYRFSHCIPIIAIQVNLVEIAGQKALHFSRIINTYEAPEHGPEKGNKTIDVAYWRNDAPWTLEAANTLLELVKPIFPDAMLNYVQSYIAIEIKGEIYFKFHKRGSNKSQMRFWYPETLRLQAKEMFNNTNISFTEKYDMLRITGDSKFIKLHAPLIVRLAELTRDSLETA